MTAGGATWALALAFALVMLTLGMNVGMLAKPDLVRRCAACRRLVRRGRTCPCSRRTGH